MPFSAGSGFLNFSRYRTVACLLAFSSLLLAGQPNTLGKDSAGAAKSKETQSQESSGKESKSDASKSQVIVLGDHLATVDLPPEYGFIDPKTASELLKKEGSSTKGILGIIAPRKESKNSYFLVCKFEDVGYVNDDDAEKLNADDLLQSYKDGTNEQNEERKGLNLPPIYIGGWAEKPHYEKKEHQVVWAIQLKNEDTKDAPVDTVNYNTRILGRRGVLSMNLVTDPEFLETNKPKVATLLNDTKFISGQTYADYKPGVDKSAGYGIAGLILGGGALAAAAKFGVFGVLWKWGLAAILILKKFIILAIVGAGSLVSRLFGKKKKAPVNSKATAGSFEQNDSQS